MRLPAVIALVVVAALAAALAGSAAAHSPNGTATYVRVRPDPRMCPSPMCGGFWVLRANRNDTLCGDGVAAQECYAAYVDLATPKLPEEQVTMLQRALAMGTTLVRGRLERRSASDRPPFDKLDTLVVTEVWLRSGQARAPGVVYRVEDNGVRCVRAPCFSLHASVLNTVQHRNLSSLGLAVSGADGAAVRRAHAHLDDTGVIVEGRIVPTADGGRTLRASAFWLRAA